MSGRGGADGSNNLPTIQTTRGAKQLVTDSGTSPSFSPQQARHNYQSHQRSHSHNSASTGLQHRLASAESQFVTANNSNSSSSSFQQKPGGSSGEFAADFKRSTSKQSFSSSAETESINVSACCLNYYLISIALFSRLKASLVSYPRNHLLFTRQQRETRVIQRYPQMKA
jgi:hypothetical protein